MTVMGLEFYVSENGEIPVATPIVIKPQNSLDEDTDDESDFRPLVIDTARRATADDEQVLPSVIKSKDCPPSGEEDNQAEDDSDSEVKGAMGLSGPMETVTLNPAAGSGSTVFNYSGGYFDTPGSRSSCSSPASSIASLSTPSRGKNSAPSKARRKTDKIVPLSDGERERYVCPVCKRVMFSQTDLTKHIRSHNNENSVGLGSNSCTICGKVLSSQSSLDRHMLVHSGERPFKCKVCNMAFTTNGNMHRHSRIHDKEGGDSLSGSGSFGDVTMVPRPKIGAPSRKSNSNKFDGSGSSSSSGSSNKMSVPISRLPLGTDAFMYALPSKRKLTFERDIADLYPAKRPNLGPYMYGHGTSEFPGMYEHYAAQHRKSIEALEIKKEVPEVEDQEEEKFQCTMCDESFTCKLSLETHLETHPEYTVKCSHCTSTFKTLSELNVHVYMVHTLKRNKSQAVGEDEENTPQNPNLPIGFHELSFVDFTSDKFPLVAQAWCEDNPRRSSSVFHTFQCQQCDKCFPCSSALDMHSTTHSSDVSTQCNKCHTFYPSTTKQRQHALEHAPAKVMTSFARKGSHDQEDAPQEVISKDNFMTVLGLKTNNREVKETKKSTPKSTEQLDGLASQIKEEYLHKNYFVKLGQAAGLFNQSGPLYSKKMIDENCNDFTSLGSIMNMTSKMPDLFSAKSANYPLTYPLFSSPYNSSSLWYGHPGFTPPSSMSAYLNMANKKKHDGEGVHQQMSSHFIPINEKQSENKKKDVNSFHCSYCTETFSDLKDFRNHERAHLGLATYRCDLCNYSASDKSTLIRHYRTHNGERPFVCRICDFAFTTKANCERHVRKKHHKDDKDEIDALISCTAQNGSDVPYKISEMDRLEGLNASETLCKYCGQEFAFSQGLQHHLRSQGGCLMKPYSCRLCSHSFSNKVNALRHMQRLHNMTEPARMEEHITVKEAILDRIKDLSPCVSPCPSSASTSPAPNSVTPPPEHNRMRLPIQPPTSTSPRPGSAFVNYRRDEGKESKPLDFSMSTKYQDANNNISDDQPMDLSLKSKPRTPEQTSKPDVSRGQLPYHAYGVGLSPNMLPVMPGPSSNSKAMGPFRPPYPLVPHMAFGAMLPPAIPPRGFPMIPFFRGHQKFPLPLGHDGKSEASGDGFPVRSIFGVPQSPANNGYSSDTSCELAPVNRMLKAADNNQFRAFLLNPEETSGGRRRNEHTIVIDEDENDEDFDDEEDDKLRKDMVTPPFASMHGANRTSSPSPANDDNTPPKKKRNSYADSPHKLECPYCPRAFPWVSSLNRHILTHTGHKPYKCPQCPVMFSTKSNRERHLVRKHGLNVLDPATRQLMDRPFKCHLCVFSSFSTAGNLLRHYREKHPETDLPDYLQYEHQAGVVEGSAITIEGGKKPLDLHDDEDYEEEEKDTVEDINMTKKFNVPAPVMPLPSPATLNPPLVKKTTPYNTPPGTPERGLNPERDNYNVDKITDCWKCRHNFADRKTLLKHLKEHNIDLPFKCYLCDASYDDRQECLDHKIERHGNDWTLLKDKNNIKDIGDFANAMNRIVEHNFINRDGNSKLLLEGDLAYYKGSLTEDLKPESDYLQRKVYCSLCPKRFWSLQDLRRHMRSHTGERPFECDICQKRFTLKHSMMRHRRKHAKEGIVSPAAGNISASDDESTLMHDDVPPMSAIPTSLGVIPSLLRAPPRSASPPPTNVLRAAAAFTRPEMSGYDLKSSDILQNLLGVDSSALDEMLTSADSAARMLGVKQ